jgi:hypothetical protein
MVNRLVSVWGSATHALIKQPNRPHQRENKHDAHAHVPPRTKPSLTGPRTVPTRLRILLRNMALQHTVEWKSRISKEETEKMQIDRGYIFNFLPE